MTDRLPLWAHVLRWLGWSVSQEFQVMATDSDTAEYEAAAGLPNRGVANHACRDGQWVRRVIEVWRD